jgi:ketosteroid isomerase-like protein
VLLATRGDRLALARAAYRHPLTEVDTLALHEVTADGQLVQFGVIFDVDDEDAAYAELDERAIALQEPGAANLRALSALMGAMNRRDVEGLRAGLAPDAQTVDHRPARFGVSGAEEFVSRAETLFELVDASVYRVTEIVRSNGPVMLWRVRARGATIEGGVFENEDWSVGVFRDGLLARLEQFPIDAFVEAEARFAELVGSPHKVAPNAASGSGPSPNAALRHAERFYAAISSDEADAAARLFAPDSVVDDRRRFVATRMSGESSLESARFLATREGLTLTGEILATRGERLVLLRQWFVHRSRDVVETLTMHEVDETGGLLQLAVMFDPDDEDAAWDELDARALEIEGEALRPLVGGVAAYNTHDIEQIATWIEDDCVLRDHLPAGWGSLTKSHYLAYTKAGFELSDDARVRVVEVVAATPWGTLTRQRRAGRKDGGEFAQEAWIVTGHPQGRVTRLEQFPIDRRVDAEACFARLANGG